MLSLPRRHLFSLIGASLFATLLPSPPLGKPSRTGQGPQGTWDVTVTFQDGPRKGEQEHLQTCIGPETFATRSAQALALFVVGWGTWSLAGHGEFRYTFREVVLDKNNQILFLIQVFGVARLSEDKSSFDATEAGTVYRLDGLLVAMSHATTHSVRQS